MTASPDVVFRAWTEQFDRWFAAIGLYASETWLWARAHASIVPQLSAESKSLMALRDRTGMEAFAMLDNDEE